jgi:nucleoside-diphosphate-sugar epimerase
VTGGAGYIGSVLVRELLERNFDVTVVDTFTGSGLTLAECCRFSSFHAVRGDVRDESLCARDPFAAVTVNRESVILLLRLLSKGQRLIFPTSNSGYGTGQGAEYCTEESPLRPISLYGQTKVEAERAILESGAGVTLRLATVFGVSPRLRLDLLVNDFTYRAVTDGVVTVFEGQFKRNFIHVRDVTRVFLHTMERYEEMVGQPFNVGLSDANLSKLELCAAIKRHVPSFVYLEAPIGRDPDQRNYVVSNAKIEATGFRPEWTIDAGIAELIKGYAMLGPARYSNV